VRPPLRFKNIAIALGLGEHPGHKRFTFCHLDLPRRLESRAVFVPLHAPKSHS
jgi:hypothetical protein